MKLISFKLFQYEIIENDLGDMWWEMHTGFGEIKRGKCFIKGDILILDSGKIKEPGFLMLEYLERLSRLSTWKKTKYYCQNPSIYSCKTNNRIILTELTNQSSPQSDNNGKEQIDSQKIISFRLGKYEIVKMPDGQLRWKTFAGYIGIKGGSCFIKENILFFESGVIEDIKLSKKIFIAQLNQLPHWCKTKYYCPHNTLYPCNPEMIDRNEHQVKTIDKSPNLRISKKAKTGKHNLFNPKLMMNDNIKQDEITVLVVKWFTYIIKVLFFVVIFLFNFLIELIGIKKK